MTKHIHIHVHGKTKDADGPKHAPAGSSKGGQFVSGSSGGSSGAKPNPASKPNGGKVLPDHSKGPLRMDVFNLYHAAGQERLQIKLHSALQAEWAEKHLGIKKSGEGTGSITLNEAQAVKLKKHLEAGPAGAGESKSKELSPERIKKFQAATRMAQLKNDQKLKKKVPTH